MSYEGVGRRGTSIERKNRAARLAKVYQAALFIAQQASAHAKQVNTLEAHAEASKAMRRVISPATKCGLETEEYREAAARHLEIVGLLRRGVSAQY